MKKKKVHISSRQNADRILSISAMVISLGTLIVILYQAGLLREQTDLLRREQHMSVLPYLEIDVANVSQNWMEMSMTNNGLGPAVIKSVYVYSGDSTVESDISTFYWENFPKNDHFEINYTTPGTMIMSGSKISLIGTNPTDSSFNAFLHELKSGQITFEIRYASIYDDLWIWKSDVGHPERINDAVD